MAKRTSEKRPSIKSPSVYFAALLAITLVVLLVLGLKMSVFFVARWMMYLTIAVVIMWGAASQKSSRLRALRENRQQESIARLLLEKTVASVKNGTSILFPVSLGYLLLGLVGYRVSPWVFYLSAAFTLAAWLDAVVFEYRIASGKYCGIDREAREMLSFILSNSGRAGWEGGKITRLASGPPANEPKAAPVMTTDRDLSGLLRKVMGFLFGCGVSGVCYGLALGVALVAAAELLMTHGYFKYTVAGLPGYCIVFGLLFGCLTGYLRRYRFNPDLETSIALINDRKAMGALSPLQTRNMYLDLCQRTLIDKTTQVAGLQTTI